MERTAIIPNLVVALLAAGRSSRFGPENKLMADLGGIPVISWAAAAGHSVTAAHHLLIAPETTILAEAAPGYRHIINPAPEQGMASSLRIAARAAQDAKASTLLILLADMPFIQAAHLGLLVDAASRDDSRPIFTRSPDGIMQPPAIFPAGFFPLLLALEGDRGARTLAANALPIDTDASQLLDIDRQEDLAEARLRLD